MLRTLQPRYSGKLLITNPDRFFGELSGRAMRWWHTGFTIQSPASKFYH
ncbi:MAG: hypothetical protein GQ567_06690 [Methanosarcinales archaeon]|nr:hypothetical protein [Methanosarcinales archaeon]